MNYKIVLVLNKNTKQRVCEHYCYKDINLDKSIIQAGVKLKIVYRSNSFFTHEIVEMVEPFEEYGLKITTSKKIWFIHG